MIRSVGLSDAQSICDIYNEYIKNSTVTFEEIPVLLGEMMGRIEAATKNYPWLVYETEKKVVGYIYGRSWRERAAYRNSVEAGIYLHPEFIGKGIGSELMKHILKILKEKSFHAVISGIALPNQASVALCEKFGFKKVAHFKEVGYKFNKWIDVGYWQLIL
ncbi:MAG: N-acetyltransferase family protein [Candidatus Kryptoniota bacterium]